jgi:hypothetical protein
MVVGQDVAAGADDDPGAEPGVIWLVFGLRRVAEEMAENRVVDERVLGGDEFLGRVYVYDRRQRSFCRFAVRAAGRGVGRVGRLAGAADCLTFIALRQPVGSERTDDEDNGETDGDALCKNQPEFAHREQRKRKIR